MCMQHRIGPVVSCTLLSPLLLVPNSPPDNVQALTSSFTAILVTWDPVPEIDRNGIVTQYEVEFNQSTFADISSSNLITTNGAVLIVELQGLEEYTEYTVRVGACTSVGPGPFSVAVVNRTLEDGEWSSVCACNIEYIGPVVSYTLLSPLLLVPNAPPDNVQTLTSSSTAILVIWDPVPEIDRNGIVTQYEVEFNQSTFADISSSNLITTNGAVLIVELQGLEEYTEYSVRVRAYTSVGPGPFSVAVVNRTLEDGEWSSVCACNIEYIGPVVSYNPTFSSSSSTKCTSRQCANPHQFLHCHPGDMGPSTRD